MEVGRVNTWAKLFNEKNEIYTLYQKSFPYVLRIFVYTFAILYTRKSTTVYRAYILVMLLWTMIKRSLIEPVHPKRPVYTILYLIKI